MAGEKQIIAHEEGVELWRNDLVHGGAVLATNFFMTTLRSPERPGFSNELAARAAFDKEVEASRASSLVQQRLGR